MGILIKPIVTEKMTAQGEKLNRYGFIVDRKANKSFRSRPPSSRCTMSPSPT